LQGKALQNLPKTGKTAAITQYDNDAPEAMADETTQKQ